MSERTSYLWQYTLPGSDLRWFCDGHMCRSPYFQTSYDGYVVCNGCLGKTHPPRNADVLIVPDVQVAVYPEDMARDLTDEELGL